MGAAFGVVVVAEPALACGGADNQGGNGYYNWTGQVGLNGSWDGTTAWISYPANYEISQKSTEHVGAWTTLTAPHPPTGKCTTYGQCWLQAGVQVGIDGNGNTDTNPVPYVENVPPALPYAWYIPPVGTSADMEFKVAYDGANDSYGYPEFDVYTDIGDNYQDVYTGELVYVYQHAATMSEALSNNGTGTTYPSCDVIAPSAYPEYFGTDGYGNVGSNDMLLEGQGVNGWVTWTPSVQGASAPSNPGPYSTNYISGYQYYAMETYGG